MKFDKALFAEIGKQLKEARIKKGMSLQDMSDAIGGIKTKQTIMRYENGETRIDTETMDAICNVLGLDAETVIDIAQIERLDSSYFSHTASYDTKEIKAKLIADAKEKKKDRTIQDTYDKADDKTKKMVRMFLGLE